MEVTASLAEHLAPSWAGVAQVCRLTRERIVRGKTSTETVYAITSLTADEAGAERLLQLSRDHWGIENKLHYVRDVSCREDQSRTNAGHAPQVLAAVPRWRFFAASVSSRSKDSNTSPNTAKPQSTWFSAREPNDPDPHNRSIGSRCGQ